MVVSRLTTLLLPLVVMTFSFGFAFSDDKAEIAAQAEKDYLNLMAALDIDVEALSDDIFFDVAGFESRHFPMQLLSLSSHAKNLEDKYALNIAAKAVELAEGQASTVVAKKDIPKKKQKIVEGQSSKAATKKAKLVLSTKHKSALLAKKKKAKKAAKKSKKKNKYALDTRGWKPKNTRLSRVYRKALKSGRVPKRALRSAFKYYEKHRHRRKLSSNYIVVADYTTKAKSRRLHLVNLRSGKVNSYQVAHGRRSGPVGGRVHSTSNRLGSNKTSKGFFKVGYKEGRTRTKGYRYLSITGLERGNRKVGLPTRMGGRDVVIHTAKYVASGGRSNGCFAIRPSDRRAIFNRIKGSLLYSYTGNV